MNKNTLPVILLRGLIIFPHAEVAIDIERDFNIKALEYSEKNKDNYVLLINQKDPLEENPDMDELFNIGIIAKIEMKQKLNSKKYHISLKALNRANIVEINKKGKMNEAITSSIESYVIDQKEELALVRQIIKKLEKNMDDNPYISNSIISKLAGTNTSARISDIIAFNLPNSIERKREYVETLNPIERLHMLLHDLHREEEIIELENKLDLEVKKQFDNNQKEYVLREKIKLIKEQLGEVSLKEDEIETIKEEINEKAMPLNIKQKLEEELKRYELTPNTSAESSMIRNYIDWLLKLPWNSYSEDKKDLKEAKRILDKSHYGLEQVKTRIIEYLAVKQKTKGLNSAIICLTGPPGTGKTSLARSIAKALGREFIKISVGGISDDAEIMGHRRTYISSMPGRIIQGMKKCGTSNPVFLIDEIDKMTKDVKGDPASSLLEVLDPEQNKYFCDRFIEEEYDLSNVIFITTANNVYEIPEALYDRLEIINISGYTEYEKRYIALKHLIPKELKEHGIKKNELSFEKDAVLTIIRNYTREAGVRDLDRKIASICRKAVMNLLSNRNKNKYIISNYNLHRYLGKKTYIYNNNENKEQVGIATGLAYTSVGGMLLPIEVTFYKGNGNLVLTGSLGEIIKESAQIALSYIKSHADELNIDYNIITNNDIHIHMPEGSQPKEGPSAGITLTTALISALTNKPIDQTIGMTGEITLRGTILPIGGLKEKAIGAHLAGIKKIIIPKDNKKDLDEIPKEIKRDIIFVPVNNYKEVLEELTK